MKLTRIKTLDLRSEEGRAEAQRQAEDRALDKMWDWPEFPSWDTKTHCITVTFHIDTSEVERKLRAAEALVKKTWEDFLVYDHLGMRSTNTWTLTATPWRRWNIEANWPVYALAVGLATLTGLIVGSYPW